VSKEQGLMSWALIGTIAIHAAIGVPVAVLASDNDDDDRIDLTQYKVIEAALAYKKDDEKESQPKKDRKPKPKADKPDGVSRDEEKKPVDRPDAGPPPTSEEDLEKLAKEFLDKHEEEEGDEPPKPGGEFNGSERGFAELGKGEPYFQELAADFFNAWELPSLEKGQGTAVASIRLDETGRIIDTEFKASGNANIDRSVQLAIRAMTKARERGDKPVPAYLLKEATQQWISFSSDQFIGE
jgi:hypothetical protein